MEQKIWIFLLLQMQFFLEYFYQKIFRILYLAAAKIILIRHVVLKLLTKKSIRSICNVFEHKIAITE